MGFNSGFKGLMLALQEWPSR